MEFNRNEVIARMKLNTMPVFSIYDQESAINLYYGYSTMQKFMLRANHAVRGVIDIYCEVLWYEETYIYFLTDDEWAMKHHGVEGKAFRCPYTAVIKVWFVDL